MIRGGGRAGGAQQGEANDKGVGGPAGRSSHGVQSWVRT